MPLLRQVLPNVFFNEVQDNTAILKFLDVQVTGVKFNTGSPCDSHATMFAEWPGDEEHVRRWYILANGKAVAINENPTGAWCYPVIEYES